jgi:stage II sporulation protein D
VILRPGRYAARTALLAVLGVAVGVMGLAPAGCTPPPGAESPAVLRIPHIGKEVPMVRVRLGEDVPTLVVAVQGPWRLMAEGGEIARGDSLAATPVGVQNGQLLVGAAPAVDGPVDLLSERDGAIVIRQTVAGAVRQRSYRGTIRLVPEAGGLVRVINTLPLEAYLAGVLANELFKTWNVEAYKAQAVAARTYALQQRNTHLHDETDLSDSTASQVYGGATTETKTSWDAVVKTWAVAGAVRGADGKSTLLKMYYSSTCGGMTASAAAVFGGPCPAPLLGGVRCEWCQASTKYRWPDVVLTKQEIAEGLRHSGYPDLATLGPVATVEVAELAGAGDRATVIRVTGKSGRAVLVRAALWRTLVGAGKVPSTWFDIQDAGDRIVLKDGRGFGHGVGMCQWGAEFLAEHGKTGEEILRYYYPGVELVRAY